MGYTCQTTNDEFLDDTIKYMEQIVSMFGEFNIKCHTSTSNVKEQLKTLVSIAFDTSAENLANYVDIINYTYCEEKRRISAAAIEHIKIRAFNQQKRCEDYQFILVNYGKEPTHKLVEMTGLTLNQIRKIISKNKKGICPEPRYTSVFEYEDFVRKNMCNNGCVSVPILTIVEVEPEMVYDFTTYSENHSFVSQSFVPSNCPVETPEGQSIGVVKNISYMTHLTIPTNSASLYEYVEPYILKVDDVPSKDLYNEVKVFINGAWIGISKKPLELYAEMKNKKYRGIINIYTSVVFDYKMAEIRICSDGGRLTRPLLKVRDGTAMITSDIIHRVSKGELEWNDLLTSCKLDESVIEYIDPEEQNYAMIAMKSKKSYLQNITTKILYTHCEIHPSTIFGVLASCAPYPDHNQSPRNTYQCLDPNELVWMADGSKIALKNIEIGDKVITFHPITFELGTTNVVNHFVRPNEFPMYEIETSSGKKIKATEDHKFMTNHGWKTVKEIMTAYNVEFREYSSRQEHLITESGWQEWKQIRQNMVKIGRYDETTKSYLFEPLAGFQLLPDGMVSDITVESNNHSFIAGTDGFLSSNCAMVKQAIGIYALNFDNRMDKSSYILNYPSRPLVDTRLMNFIQLNRIPSGCQVHVAIASFTGYNQEDSILINQGSIDRGMFSATIYHTEKDEDKNIIRDEIIRCKPDPTKTKCIKFGNYDKLNSQGFIEENELVENRDIIIAKIIPIKENRNDPTKTIKYEDQSKNFRTTEETYIDKNYTCRNGDGYNSAKVRVRTFRKPVIGDKFASRSAQKGTIGNIIPEKDMPFTKDGLRPDIILNPHAIPSRMTIGQLKETLLGKVLLELGLFGDGTSFGNLSVKTIAEELQNLGYESYGNEIMYNGMTGEQMETSIFFGPVFYQRLKHMVNDKQHSRAIGPMVNLTHQPAEGRSRDGGFRIGEMERDVLCSHGMTKFTRERLFDVSDKYSVNVCKKCGMIACFNDGDKNRAYTNNDFSIHLCKTCGNKTDFALVEMPYANKLLFQELQTINVVPRVITE
jgi:DNA-directed RNA polymerase beta subunit